MIFGVYKILNTNRTLRRKTKVYVFRRGPSGSGSDEEYLVYEVDGLRPATAYALRLAAVNAIGDSDYTEPVIVQTLEEGKEIITDAIHY